MTDIEREVPADKDGEGEGPYKKYYWLKLNKNFFKRHDIKVLLSLPGGRDFVLLYLKLLLESVSHNGRLRFSESVCYTDQMLAVVTDTETDIVKAGLEKLYELGFIERLSDGTLFLKEAPLMLGSETKWAKLKRLARKRQEESEQGERDGGEGVSQFLSGFKGEGKSKPGNARRDNVQ